MRGMATLYQGNQELLVVRGIRGLMRGMATLSQGNQELLVVKRQSSLLAGSARPARRCGTAGLGLPRRHVLDASGAPFRHRALDEPVIGLPGHQRSAADQRHLGPVVAVLDLDVVHHVHLGQALVAAVVGVADVQQLVRLVSGDAV